MKTFGIKTLLKLCDKFRTDYPDFVVNFPKTEWAVEERAIRFYQFSEVMRKPNRVGRDNAYSAFDLKQLVAAKILQGIGYHLERIKAKAADPDTIIEEYGPEFGLTPESFDRFINENVSDDDILTETNEPEEAMTTPATAAVQPQTIPFTEPNEKTLQCTWTSPSYDSLRPHLRVGNAFAFLFGLPDPVAKDVHKLLYGQKKKGKVEQAVLAIEEDGLELPGVHIARRPMSRDLTILVSDKDVYREAEDVAQIYVFDPTMPSKQVTLQVLIDGVSLESIVLTLDENGCGLTRFPTVAAGRYTVKVVGKTNECSFEAARYTLAPFTATSVGIRRSENNLIVGLSAESFGAEFEGKVKASVYSEGTLVSDHEIEFVGGTSSLTFASHPQAEGSYSIRLMSLKNPDLIAQVPLSGTRKSERETTAISSLGKLRSISLISGNAGAVSARGLWFEEGAITNTPIRIASSIDEDIQIEALADTEMLTVIVREPITGTMKVVEVGELKKGKKKKISFNSSVAAVSIGAFVNGKPWEGHAGVVKPVSHKLTISAKKRIEPGETLELTLKSRSRASVLVRIADKRVRTMDDAKTATAARLKGWINEEVANLHTGDVTAGMNNYGFKAVSATSGYRGIKGGGGGRAGGAGMVFGAATFAAAERPRQRMLRAAEDQKRYMIQPEGLNMQFTPNDEVTMRAQGLGEETHYAMAHNDADDVSRRGGVPDEVELSGLVYEAAAAPAGTGAAVNATLAKVAKKKESAREMQVDLVYCGLVQVRGEKTLRIRMPDCIGEYDITAFSVSGDDWSETKADISVTKEHYLEPMIPQVAHPEDEVRCTVVGVRGIDLNYKVKVNGEEIRPKITATTHDGNMQIEWAAVPGSHEIAMLDTDGNEVDKVLRVVECPGEETVLGQELKILKPGEKYDISLDENVLSLQVLPGIEGELKVAVRVVTDFQHYCCEQTSALVTAACLAAVMGDENEKTNAFKGIVNGANRLRSMYQPGRGFASYPGSGINENWSAAAARRTARLDVVAEKTFPEEVQKAVRDMVEMGKNVLAAHGTVAMQSAGEFEKAYFDGTNVAAEAKIDEVITKLQGASAWDSHAKAEAAYCGAILFRTQKIEAGIKVVNAVAKAMAGALGGSTHGTCEALAYMYLMSELSNAGIVPGAGATKVKVNGKDISIEKAMAATGITAVESIKAPVALRIVRLSRIRFDDMNATVGITVDVLGSNGARTFQPGDRVNLKVTLTSGYKDGDLVAVSLPDCLSRIIAGAKAKKFQVDFRGRNEASIELVAGTPTQKPQRWAAVVRNMYDGARLGSVGLMTTEVTK